MIVPTVSTPPLRRRRSSPKCGRVTFGVILARLLKRRPAKPPVGCLWCCDVPIDHKHLVGCGCGVPPEAAEVTRGLRVEGSQDDLATPEPAVILRLGYRVGSRQPRPSRVMVMPRIFRLLACLVIACGLLTGCDNHPEDPIQKARKEGYAAGEAAGKKSGHDEGLSEGKEIGYWAGYLDALPGAKHDLPLGKQLIVRTLNISILVVLIGFFGFYNYKLVTQSPSIKIRIGKGFVAVIAWVSAFWLSVAGDAGESIFSLLAEPTLPYFSRLLVMPATAIVSCGLMLCFYRTWCAARRNSIAAQTGLIALMTVALMRLRRRRAAGTSA
jgi:hypothetical protein